MKLRNLILLGITSFSATAIWNMPAAFAYQYLPLKNIQANGLSGTVWNGEVKEVVTKTLTLNNISWSVDLLESITSLALKSKLEIQDPDITFKGLAGFSISQTISLDDAQFETTGAFASKFQKLATLRGDIKGSIKHFEMEKGTLPVLDASYHWKQGELLSPMRIQPAGDYSIIVKPSDKGLTANISSSNAPLELSGDAKIESNWKYKTNIKIKAANASGKGTMNMVKMAVGKLEKDGSAIIKQQGQLKAFY
ncbi:MAG: type II secretion system protein N [Cocleimonas sp.]|nr:type II secretion system protein N [Cocleimonas sp.]